MKIRKLLFLMVMFAGSLEMQKIIPKVIEDVSVSNNNEVGEIQEAILQVKGLVGTAYITGVLNSLKNIKGIMKAKVIDTQQGLVRISLKSNNKFSFAQLQRLIGQEVKNAGCLCDAIKKIMVTGFIKKDDYGYFLHIENTDDKIYLTKMTKGFKKYKKQLQQWHGNATFVRLMGSVHSHPDGCIALDTIESLSKVDSLK